MMMNTRANLRFRADEKVRFQPDFSNFFVLDGRATKLVDVFLTVSELDEEDRFEDALGKKVISDFKGELNLG
jgi:hypothetical protein